jgi:hypothetical protein
VAGYWMPRIDDSRMIREFCTNLNAEDNGALKRWRNHASCAGSGVPSNPGGISGSHLAIIFATDFVPWPNR